MLIFCELLWTWIPWTWLTSLTFLSNVIPTVLLRLSEIFGKRHPEQPGPSLCRELWSLLTNGKNVRGGALTSRGYMITLPGPHRTHHKLSRTCSLGPIASWSPLFCMSSRSTVHCAAHFVLHGPFIANLIKSPQETIACRQMNMSLISTGQGAAVYDVWIASTQLQTFCWSTPVQSRATKKGKPRDAIATKGPRP